MIGADGAAGDWATRASEFDGGLLSTRAATVVGATAFVVSALLSAICVRAALDGVVLARGRFVSDDARLPISQTPPSTAANPAPIPRHILASIGGRSGFVWHHLHSPSCSG